MMKILKAALLTVLMSASLVFAQPAPPRQQGSVATTTENLDMIGCVRADTAAVAAGVADGDRVRCIVDATGKLWVNVGSVAVTNAGTFATQATLQAGTAEIGKLAAGVAEIGNVKNSGTFAVQSTNAAETTKVLGTVRAQGNLGAAFDAATGAAPPANAILAGGIVGGATGGFMGGIPVCDTQAVVNISTITTTLIVTGVSGRHVRICGFELITAAANNVAFLSGTGATCGTGTAGMSGGTTAASGYNLAANGGIAHGSGVGTVKKTVATGDSVCLITSATTQLSGSLSYVIY